MYYSLKYTPTPNTVISKVCAFFLLEPTPPHHILICCILEFIQVPVGVTLVTVPVVSLHPNNHCRHVLFWPVSRIP